MQHKNGRDTKKFGNTLKDGGAPREAWVQERQVFIDMKNALQPGQRLNKRSAPDSAQGQQQKVEKRKSQKLMVENCLGNLWTPDLLNKHHNIELDSTVKLQPLTDDDGTTWGVYRLPENDPPPLPAGVKRVTRVFSEGSDHTLLANDSTQNVHESETAEAWKSALQGGKCNVSINEERALTILSDKASTGEDDGFCAVGMFAAPRAAALKRRGSAASAASLDETEGMPTAEPSDPKKAKAETKRSRVKAEPTDDGAAPALRPREQEKLKAKGTRLCIAGKKAIQDRSRVSVLCWVLAYVDLLLTYVDPSSVLAVSMLRSQDAGAMMSNVLSDAGANVAVDSLNKLVVKVEKLLEPEAIHIVYTHHFRS